ncbi:MAG: PilN domain-containing protein [Bdellovibrio bacteriovorus]
MPSIASLDLGRVELGSLKALPRWFLERFHGCLPGVVRQWLARRDRRLIVAPGLMSARLLLASGLAPEESGEDIGILDLTGLDPLPPRVAGGAKELPHRTVLRLPGEAVLTRRASFPAQVREKLPQVIRLELDRLSPFSADQVVYDFALVPGAKGDARIAVDLALCRRDRVADWIKRLREGGSPIDQITWEGAWPSANLLPPEERPRRRKPLLNGVWLLSALILVLLIAAVGTPLWQKARLLEALDAELSRARSQAVQVDEARKDLEQAREGSTVVLQHKWDQPRVTDLLRELTDRIPDDTWVQSLEYQGREVQVRGESGQATALIGILEGAPGIEGVSFRSPVTQVARTGKERFNLAFTLKPEASP